jgi:hypothetical protein
MLYHRTPTQLYNKWQSEIEAGLEAGQTPVIDLGSGSLLFGILPTLVALQYLTARRTDVTTPTLLVNGVNPLWTAALLQAGAKPDGRGALLPTVVFGGADTITYMASLPTFKLERLGSPLRAPVTPVNMTPLFVPDVQASPLSPWAALPFALAGTIDSKQRNDAHLARVAPPVVQIDDWTTWIGIAVSAALILLAFLT